MLNIYILHCWSESHYNEIDVCNITMSSHWMAHTFLVGRSLLFPDVINVNCLPLQNCVLRSSLYQKCVYPYTTRVAYVYHIWIQREEPTEYHCVGLHASTVKSCGSRIWLDLNDKIVLCLKNSKRGIRKFLFRYKLTMRKL